MKRKVPNITSDKEAEVLLEQDLSDLDFSQFKPTKFEFKSKDERINMRLPNSLLKAVKVMASEYGMPYQRLIRQILEGVVVNHRIHNNPH